MAAAVEQVAEVGSNSLVGSSVAAVGVAGSPEHLVEYLGNHRKLKEISSFLIGKRNSFFIRPPLDFFLC